MSRDRHDEEKDPKFSALFCLLSFAARAHMGRFNFELVKRFVFIETAILGVKNCRYSSIAMHAEIKLSD